MLNYSLWTSVGDREPKKRRKSSDGETRKRKQLREKKTVRLKKGDGEGEEELFSFLEKEAGSEVSGKLGVRYELFGYSCDRFCTNPFFMSLHELGSSPAR